MRRSSYSATPAREVTRSIMASGALNAAATALQTSRPADADQDRTPAPSCWKGGLFFFLNVHPLTGDGLERDGTKCILYRESGKKCACNSWLKLATIFGSRVRRVHELDGVIRGQIRGIWTSTSVMPPVRSSCRLALQWGLFDEPQQAVAGGSRDRSSRTFRCERPDKAVYSMTELRIIDKQTPFPVSGRIAGAE